MPLRVNINATVVSTSIRREIHNEQEHIVIPSYTLPGNVVMNGGLYPTAEIDAHYLKLEGTMAPVGHPTVNGKHVSAFSPEALSNPQVNAGAWNRNVKKVGNRVYSEKWINVNMAQSTEAGKRILERVAAFERGDKDVPPIHTSIAVYVDKEEITGNSDYTWIAHIKGIDHDAILLDEPGAATPDDGVGLMVNSADAKPVIVNSGVLDGESYGEKQQRLESAIRAKFNTDNESYAWLADFTDTQAVISRDGIYTIFGYKIEAGAVVIDETGIPVQRRESWVIKFNQRLTSLFSVFTKPPVIPANEGNDMPMTDEEIKKIAEIAANAAAAAVKPVADAVTAQGVTLTGITATLAANALAAQADKRAVVEKAMGKDVADLLQGNALDAVFAKLSADAGGTAATLAANSGHTPGNKTPDMSPAI